MARSQAQLGLIPESAAHSIVGSCKVELFDVSASISMEVMKADEGMPVNYAE